MLGGKMRMKAQQKKKPFNQNCSKHCMKNVYFAKKTPWFCALAVKFQSCV